MSKHDRWLLPEGIEEVLPGDAWRLEQLRRRLLDRFDSWGYELVIPPLVEYLESLLTGTGNDLDLQTFKLTDQLTGRMLGIRADMTPQVARIDTHQLRRDVPTRLCYLGTVLHTRPSGMGGSRSPLQFGAELYGHSGIESDLEVLRLMLESLRAVGVEDIHLDLGHVGIFRALAAQAALSAEQESSLFDALQRKSAPEVRAYLNDLEIEADVSAMLGGLADLNGGPEMLMGARQALAGASGEVMQALDYLAQLAEQLKDEPGVTLHVDLAELRGYHYHTGAVFAAYVPGQGQAIAVGGRYDDIGRVFGRARAATGFSSDLKQLMELVSEAGESAKGIYAPAQADAALDQRIAELRAAGERVIRALPGQPGGAAEMGCDRILERSEGGWRIVAAT